MSLLFLQNHLSENSGHPVLYLTASSCSSIERRVIELQKEKARNSAESSAPPSQNTCDITLVGDGWPRKVLGPESAMKIVNKCQQHNIVENFSSYTLPKISLEPPDTGHSTAPDIIRLSIRTLKSNNFNFQLLDALTMLDEQSCVVAKQLIDNSGILRILERAKVIAPRIQFRQPLPWPACSNSCSIIDGFQAEYVVHEERGAAEEPDPQASISQLLGIRSKSSPVDSFVNHTRHLPTSAGFDGSQQSYSPQAGPTPADSQELPTPISLNMVVCLHKRDPPPAYSQELLISRAVQELPSMLSTMEIYKAAPPPTPEHPSAAEHLVM